MTSQDLLRRFVNDIRELNGDPCQEVFNPDSEIMKIKSQYQLVQKLTDMADRAQLPLAGGRTRRLTKHRKSKRGKVVKKSSRGVRGIRRR